MNYNFYGKERNEKEKIPDGKKARVIQVGDFIDGYLRVPNNKKGQPPTRDITFGFMLVDRESVDRLFSELERVGLPRPIIAYTDTPLGECLIGKMPHVTHIVDENNKYYVTEVVPFKEVIKRAEAELAVEETEEHGRGRK
mgnify:CR=1 FL=1